MPAAKRLIRKYLATVLMLLLVPAQLLALEFSEKIVVKVPPAVLWEIITKALEGKDNGVWPDSYSSVSGEFKEGGKVTETFSINGLTIDYEIDQITEGQKLRYRPRPGAPMTGESFIQILPHHKNSELYWHGRYEVSNFSFIGIGIRIYEVLFFQQLRKNLQAFKLDI
ncbi:MAG: hypothetical protein CMP10_19680 [Zetaproteobacteria bacterium]|nr:hypothetical protein [Pseudobdellovibrionaceae bacterium]